VVEDHPPGDFRSVYYNLYREPVHPQKNKPTTIIRALPAGAYYTWKGAVLEGTANGRTACRNSIGADDGPDMTLLGLF
jgi:hypothetical protein